MTNDSREEVQAIVIEDWLGKSAILDLGPNIQGVQVWGPQTNANFQADLLTWYDQNKRQLPWRMDPTPYHVWVSEIMLQQTQVDTVIPYYQHFLQRFPTIESLAEAQEADLMKAWEGLGYYSRVRNMQTAAQTVVKEFAGQFPQTYDEIIQLKGIGPYTAAAIASIAFNEAKAAVDGNAMRVYSRLLGISADIAKSKHHKLFFAIGDYLIAKDRPGDFNQAIMDLGSSFETAKAAMPLLSPVADYTLATLTGQTEAFPVKSKKKKPKVYYYDALIIKNQQDRVLIQQRDQDQLLAKLWTVPLFSHPEKKDQEVWTNLVAETKAKYDFSPVVAKQAIGQVKHVFSHQVWYITIYLAYVKAEDANFIRDLDQKSTKSDWVSAYDLSRHAYPTVQMKIWQAYRDYLTDKNQ
ncbi:A/G-specific adenine glycosylase [Aerococcus kribbianus]|uniref:Adenine DNA glycosylase n=1 Tax=Aerococcus kribbianus TaxID=2999064 RepID=A0A9X3JFU0_9LACT|nr:MULTISPECIES: A/G-specific adenine glycosylase [unclassified Aerococcus]MCZ0718120.1 A/G-specific adenine glycosylase [Aerococcus sp. YH-aer221]MCZ0726311.1 A/G-specific adenine glycosylase [Aerococcus sp. YH-aer222]